MDGVEAVDPDAEIDSRPIFFNEDVADRGEDQSGDHKSNGDFPKKEFTFELFVPNAICLAIGNFIFVQAAFLEDMTAIPYRRAFPVYGRTHSLLARRSSSADATRYPLAISRVVGVTLLPPLLVILLILWSGRGFHRAKPIFAVWFVACGIYDPILIHRAKKQLRSHFRDLAAESAQPAVRDRRPLPKPVQWLLLLEPAQAHEWPRPGETIRSLCNRP